MGGSNRSCNMTTETSYLDEQYRQDNLEEVI